ncbi:hypothetical protein [Rheinheimera riviphila]|nr:hypothetical protein [Rheinheimera riviphila]
MEEGKNWKLKLRYGKETTPYKHFTALSDGLVGDMVGGFECPKGPAIMAMKTWATDAGESADMLRVIGAQIGFEATGEIQVYETEPEQPPKDNPFGYGINFTSYDE